LKQKITTMFKITTYENDDTKELFDIIGQLTLKLHRLESRNSELQTLNEKLEEANGDLKAQREQSENKNDELIDYIKTLEKANEDLKKQNEVERRIYEMRDKLPNWMLPPESTRPPSLERHSNRDFLSSQYDWEKQAFEYSK